MIALVVDDSRASRAMLRRMLDQFGFSTVEAADGVEALQRLNETECDLALVDWHMPEMDGLELVRTMRRKSGHTKVPVMMVTGECDPRQMARALMAGADEYAIKPLDLDGLREKLQILGFDPSGHQGNR